VLDVPELLELDEVIPDEPADDALLATLELLLLPLTNEETSPLDLDEEREGDLLVQPARLKIAIRETPSFLRFFITFSSFL